MSYLLSQGKTMQNSNETVAGETMSLPGDALQSEIDANLEFFLSKLPDLLRDQVIAGIYDTARDAQMTGERFYDDGLFSIQKVTRESIDLGYFSHAVHLG